MKIKFLKLKSWLLTTIMGVVGLSGCKTVAPVAEPEKEPLRPTPRQEIRVMYGVPTMNYQIRGHVHDAGGQPLSDIRVNMLERNIEATGDSLHGDPERVQAYLTNTEVRTDAEGNFTIERSDLPQEQVRLLVRDVDGQAGGGEFRNRMVEVPVTREGLDTVGAGGWFQGTFRHQMDVRLENK